MESKMLQQIVVNPKEITFKEVDIPKVKQGNVLIKMMRIGVCGSDIHVYHGQHPYVTYPLTQGHEVSGKIVEVGEGVTDLKVGQRVTIEPQVVCGKCHPCTHGKYNLCEELKVMGFQTTGAASEYFEVSAQKVVVLPQNVSYDHGAMIEPLAVAVHAVRMSGDVLGIKAVVLGAGPIGALLCQTLKAFGAKEVLVTDVSDYRLDIVKNCGADYVCNTAKADFGQEMIKVFGKDKADIIYDCAGNDTTMKDAITNARKGSIIMLIAVFAKMANVDLAKLNDSELDLKTSMMYRHEDYVDAIKIINEKKVDLEPLISKHFAFKDYKNAYEYIDANREKTLKVLIDIGEDN